MENLTSTIADLTNRFVLFLPKIAAALVIFVVGIYLANFVVRLMVTGLQRRKSPKQLTQFIGSYGRTTLYMLTVLIALQQIDFDLTAFLAGLGILGFTIGFALQDITQNLVSGLILLVQRPFEIGDLLQIEDFTGYVMAIDIRTTRIHTLDGRDVLIPNYTVIRTSVINYTIDPHVRVCVQVNLPFDSDIEHVTAVAQTAIENIGFVRQTPPVEILFSAFGDSALKLKAYYWINILRIPERQAIDQGIRALSQAFAKHDIQVPYPVQVELQGMYPPPR